MTAEEGTGGASRGEPALATSTKHPDAQPAVGSDAGATATPPAGKKPDTGSKECTRGNDFPLSDIMPGALDKRGRYIVDVLWAVRDFKIYKTTVGVSPHFSDDPKVAEVQWQRYAALGSELAQVNYLVDLFRPRRKKRAGAEGDDQIPEDSARMHFEREMARAIAQALLGNPEQGRASLAALTASLEKRLRNRGRVVYLAVCVVSAIAISGLAALFLSNGVDISVKEVALAAIMGSIGALFSTAAGLPALRLDPVAVSYMNFVYGGQRMLVGVLGAVVLYLALRAGFVHELLPGADGLGENETMNAYQLAFLSVLAGFSERLVPNLLEQTANGGEGTTHLNRPDTQDAAAQQAAAQSGQASAPSTDKGKEGAG